MVATPCYLINRSPTLVLVEKTHMEAWSSKKTSMRHLKVLGYDAYANLPNEKRSKLENRAFKCIFIIYGISMKGCKLWDPIVEKVLYSRSVIFRVLKPSTIDLQVEKEEKQKNLEVDQIPPTPERVELHIPMGPDNKESSNNSKSLEEEQDPQP